MLRTQFEEELLNLHNQFYEMGMMVSSAVHKSVKAYINHDKKLAQEVIDRDIEINDMEVKLEKKSFEMIALQQPVTTDLRMIITVMKASSDLERMADHAVSIAKSTIRFKGETRIPEIEKEIQKSDLGITPSNDGKLIRLPFPQLTEDRRKELTKIVSKKGEDTKIIIRNLRRDLMDSIKKAEKDGDISEDDRKTFEDDAQKLTDKYTEKIDAITKDKQAELMEV